MYRERKRTVRAITASKPKPGATTLTPFKPNSRKLNAGFKFIGNGLIQHEAAKDKQRTFY